MKALGNMTKSKLSQVLQERGVSVLSTAIVLPFIIVIMVVLFDLGRIYLATVLAKEVSLAAAKFATSKAPETSTPDEIFDLIRLAPGETSIAARYQFWNDQLTEGSGTYHGKDFYTSKELRVFNLAYGFLYDLNPDVAFPLPEPLSNKNALYGTMNCAIYFEFDGLGDTSDQVTNRSRIYYCKCALPLIGLSLFQSLTGRDYVMITESAYAYHSGNLL